MEKAVEKNRQAIANLPLGGSLKLHARLGVAVGRSSDLQVVSTLAIELSTHPSFPLPEREQCS